MADLRDDQQFLTDYPGAHTISPQQVGVHYGYFNLFPFHKHSCAKSCCSISGTCYCCLTVKLSRRLTVEKDENIEIEKLLPNLVVSEVKA